MNQKSYVENTTYFDLNEERKDDIFFILYQINTKHNEKYINFCSYYCFINSVDICFGGVFVKIYGNKLCNTFETVYHRVYDSQKNSNSACGRISVLYQVK